MLFRWGKLEPWGIFTKVSLWLDACRALEERAGCHSNKSNVGTGCMKEKGEVVLSFVMGGLHTDIPFYEYTLASTYMNTNTQKHTNGIACPPPRRSQPRTHTSITMAWWGWTRAPSWEPAKTQSDTPGVQNHLHLINMITGHLLVYIAYEIMKIWPSLSLSLFVCVCLHPCLSYSRLSNCWTQNIPAT